MQSDMQKTLCSWEAFVCMAYLTKLNRRQGWEKSIRKVQHAYLSAQVHSDVAAPRLVFEPSGKQHCGTVITRTAAY